MTSWEARRVLIDTKREQLSAIVNTYQALGGGGYLFPIPIPPPLQSHHWWKHSRHSVANTAVGSGPEPPPTPAAAREAVRDRFQHRHRRRQVVRDRFRRRRRQVVRNRLQHRRRKRIWNRFQDRRRKGGRYRFQDRRRKGVQNRFQHRWEAERGQILCRRAVFRCESLTVSSNGCVTTA